LIEDEKRAGIRSEDEHGCGEQRGENPVATAEVGFLNQQRVSPNVSMELSVFPKRISQCIQVSGAPNRLISAC